MSERRPSWWPADVRHGPTPAGGVRSEAFWYDEHGEPCEKRDASSALIVEYAADGTVLNRTHGTMKPSPPAPPPPPSPPANEPATYPPTDSPVRSMLAAGVPSGWFRKESLTILAPNGQGNVIFSCEPLSPEIDAFGYADVQGNLLRREFERYQEESFEPGLVFGDKSGYVRRFNWAPPDGVPVSQTQLYYAVPGRGFTATATAPGPRGAMSQQLEQILMSLRIVDGP